MLRIVFASTVAAACSVLCVRAGSVKLAQDSRALCDIVLSDSPSPVEITAARELKKHLDAVAGADFKIRKLSETPVNRAVVYVGDSRKTREIFSGLNFSQLPADTVLIKTSGGDVALCGHPERGTLYAAYTLLEDFVGVRWWSAQESFIPRKTSVEIPSTDISYSPVFKTREALYKIAFDPVFAVRMKQNGSTLTKMNFDRPVIAKEYGGCERLVLFRGRGSSFHSHYEILPPEKYFKSHPEWYGEVGGKRVPSNGQLCLTNGEMAEEYLKNVKILLRENPDASAIQVSQNDWYNPCECPKCRAFEAARGGVCSATNIHFANLIGAGIEEEFPNVFIDTFAYQYTRRAPSGIAPRKNVLVRLCTIECDFLRPMTDASNADFARDMREWGALTKNLFVWDYVTNFRSYMRPHPNMRILAPNIKFFAENGAAGIFEQGDAFCTAGDFVRLRSWVISHLMWNPDADAEKLFDEFLYGYYGREVGEIFKEYLKTIHDSAEKSGVTLGCYSGDVSEWLDTDSFNRALSLMDAAQKTAERLEREDSANFKGLSAKVRRERIPLDYAALAFYKNFCRKAERAQKKINLPENPTEAARKLCATWNEFNVGTWREFTTAADFAKYQKKFVEDVARQEELLKISKIPAAKDPELSEKILADIQEPDFVSTDSELFEDFSAPYFADAAASNGYAAELPSGAAQGAIRTILGGADTARILAGEKIPRKVSAFARISSPVGNSGTACWFKVVSGARTVEFRRQLNCSEFGIGAYKTVHLCDIEMRSATPYKFSFIKEEKNSGNLRIDRIIIARAQ